MTDYLTELFNMFTAFAIGFPLMLYPMWKERSIKKRIVYAYIVCFAVLISAALFVVRKFITIDLNTIQGFKLCFLIPQFILPFITFRKKIWQVIFLIILTSMYYLIFTGISNSVTEMRFPENPLFYSALISNAVIGVTFPPLIIMLRRLYGNSGAARATAFWRLAWLIPAAFHVIILVPGNYVTGSDFGSWFITIRIFAYAVSIFICYMFDIVVRQISEAETAKRKAEEQTAKADFYQRTAHELLTPLTRVSTNVQVLMTHPELSEEYLAESQGEIMAMADKISKALDESEAESEQVVKIPKGGGAE